METKYLKEFLVLADTQSSYATAEKLFVSQSTLIRHIQAIESEFGVPLFDRSNRGFILNDAGQIFRTYARQIVMAEEQCHKILHDNEGESRVLRLCAQGKIVDLLADFGRENPEILIDYYETDDPVRDLRNGTIELSFLSDTSPIPAEFEKVPCFQEEVLAVLYEGHPLADRESVTLEEISRERFIGLSDNIIYDRAFTEMYGSIGSVHNVIMTVPTGDDLLRMVHEKLGISLIHGVMETIPAYPGLKCVPLHPHMQYTIVMCYRRDTVLSYAAQQFIAYTRKWIISHKALNLSLF